MEVKLINKLPLLEKSAASWHRPLSRDLYLIGGEEFIVSEIRVEERYTETAVWRTGSWNHSYMSEHFRSENGTAAEILAEIRRSDKPTMREMMGW